MCSNLAIPTLCVCCAPLLQLQNNEAIVPIFSPDQGDIPEECESDVLHPSGDMVDGNCVTAPVPATAPSLQDFSEFSAQTQEKVPFLNVKCETQKDKCLRVYRYGGWCG